MKTLSIFTILLTLGISFSSFVVSRQLPTLEKHYNNPNNTLRIHRQGTGVALTWSGSANAVSYIVERSYDTEFFEPVIELGNDGSRFCRYKDENVFPGDIYYRIVSVDANGNKEFSQIAAIKIRMRG